MVHQIAWSVARPIHAGSFSRHWKFRALGEGLWRPSAPKGYPDDEASWIDGVGRRLDVANNFAERIAGMADPQVIIEDVFASEIAPEVKQAVGRAESRQQALALLFMSADFQRR